MNNKNYSIRKGQEEGKGGRNVWGESSVGGESVGEPKGDWVCFK